MKTFFFAIFFFSGMVFSGQTDTLTVLYLNDTHSCLAPMGPRNPDLTGTTGGIARAASVIENYELITENILTLHSGDFSIGDLFYNKYFGVPELQMLNQIGVDAMTAGNHEFDLGPGTFDAALTAAFGIPSTGFPILSANADLSSYPGTLNQFIKPYTVKDFGDFKVGVFGLTTHETNLLSNPSPVIINEDFITIAGGVVQTLLTTEDCDFIICLSHYGFLADQAIAAYVPGINLIVGGHDHIPVPPMQVGNTWIVQGYAQYAAVCKIDFILSTSGISMAENEIIKLNSSIPENPAIAAVVNGLISDIELTYGPVYTQQIGSCNSFMEEYSGDIMKPGNHSTPCGNFITDAMLWKTGTDFAIEPAGSIAMGIAQGPVVPVDLFRTVGYGFNTQNGLGFRLITAEILGSELYKALEILLSYLDNEDFFPQFSGLTLKYIPDAPEGERIFSVRINNKALNPISNYTFSSNELVLAMLDILGIVYQNPVVFDSYSEFQNLCDYSLYMGGKIKGNNQARVIGVGSVYNGNVPVMQKPEVKSQNYPNPFNPETVINFTLPSDGNVKLVIYNLLGEAVEVLTDGYKQAGDYQLNWNASAYPGGVYFYTIQTDSYSDTAKMILLK